MLGLPALILPLLLALPLGTNAHGLHEERAAQHHRLAQKLASVASVTVDSVSLASAAATTSIIVAETLTATSVLPASISVESKPTRPNRRTRIIERAQGDTTVWQTATVTQVQTQQLTVRAAPPGATDASIASSRIAGWETLGCE